MRATKTKNDHQESRSMLKAKDIMTTDLITVSPDTEITQATKILLDKRVNGLPVLDSEGRLVGLICQSDLVMQQKKIALPSLFNLLDGLIPLRAPKNFEQEIRKITATTVGQAMVTNPVTVTPETELTEIATLMVEKKYHTLPVLDGGKLVGVIGKEDVLRTILGLPRGETD
jgi:CBS-domain-containing membrane protein